jgi:hypothetical protein
VIEVERSKPYVVVRQVTVISLVTLAGVYLLAPDFFARTARPIGPGHPGGPAGALPGVVDHDAPQGPTGAPGPDPGRRRPMNTSLVLLAGVLLAAAWSAWSPPSSRPCPGSTPRWIGRHRRPDLRTAAADVGA